MGCGAQAPMGGESRRRPTWTRRSGRYARGYFFKYDQYNGINFAFLLDVRATSTTGDEALADHVVAKRIRREILAICDRLLAEGSLKGDDAFWVLATKVEALFGLLHQDAERLKEEAIDKAPRTVDGRDQRLQIDKLKALLS